MQKLLVFNILLLLCVAFADQINARPPLPQRSSFALNFMPQPGKVPRARALQGIGRNLETFTLCHWSQLLDLSKGQNTVFEYATPTFVNEILSVIRPRENQVSLYIQNTEISFPYVTPLEKWQHICYTWSTFSGNLNVFVNGNKIAERKNFKNGTIIKGYGEVSYGNDQIEYGSERYANDWVAFGKVTEVHVWDYILSDWKIHQLSKCDSSLEGNVLAWGKTGIVLIHTEVQFVYDVCDATCER